MLQALHIASDSLKSALERYLDVCLAVSSQDHLTTGLSDVSDDILKEMRSISGFEEKIDRSKKLIGKLRNRCTRIAPINMLPPELLARIFSLAHKVECYLRPDYLYTKDSTTQTKSIAPLLRTCSYWRSVALDSHSLWTHVDLEPFGPHKDEMLNRARHFASHSGHLPVGIHISMSGSRGHTLLENGYSELCAHLAARTNYIEIGSIANLDNVQLSILDSLLGGCTPGTLIRLSITADSRASRRLFGFIVAGDSEDRPDRHKSLEISHQRFEDVLRGVISLRVENIFPFWTSQAYAGLVRLHLANRTSHCISTFWLAYILRASPQLRIFRLGFKVTEEDPNNRPLSVSLNQLEDIHLESADADQHERVLRLISAGPKPLRVAIAYEGEGVSSLTTGAHKLFFACSNATQLRVVKGSSAISPDLILPELLGIIPSLQFLYLDGFDIRSHQEAIQVSTGRDNSAGAWLGGREIYITRSQFDLEVLRRVAENFRIIKMVIDPWTCRVIESEPTLQERSRLANPWDYEKDLKKISSAIILTSCEQTGVENV